VASQQISKLQAESATLKASERQLTRRVETLEKSLGKVCWNCWFYHVAIMYQPLTAC